MPQVASDPKIYAHNPLPRLARPTQQSDRAPSPFESLLDDGAQAADQPAPTPDNKASPADNAQAPAKSNDCKTATTNDTATGTATKPDDADPSNKPDDDGKPVGDDKVDAKAKTAAAAGDGIKVADDDKPAEGPKTDNPTIAAPTDNIQTIATADAVALTPVTTPLSDQTPTQPPTVDHVEQLIQPAELPAIIADGTNLKAFDPTAPKVATGKQVDAGKQADADKPADANLFTNEITDNSQPTGKVAPQPHVDKPQLAATDSDKEHIADARGEIPANGHHANPDATASVSTDANIGAPKAADATQPGITNTTQTTTTAPAGPVLTAPPVPQAAAIPLAGVAIEIAGKALAGKNCFEIRLDPPELGRIEVRLDVDRDGNVTSRLTVDRADTLDLLRRDASGLERALQDAGLKTADNSLQFSLRDQSTSQQQTGNGSDTAQLVAIDETLPSLDVIPQNYSRLTGQGGGLDIRV